MKYLQVEVLRAKQAKNKNLSLLSTSRLFFITSCLFTLLNCHSYSNSQKLSDWYLRKERKMNMNDLLRVKSSNVCATKKVGVSVCKFIVCIKSSEDAVFNQPKNVLNEGLNINMSPAATKGHSINLNLYITLYNSSGEWVKVVIDYITERFPENTACSCCKWSSLLPLKREEEQFPFPIFKRNQVNVIRFHIHGCEINSCFTVTSEGTI